MPEYHSDSIPSLQAEVARLQKENDELRSQAAQVEAQKAANVTPKKKGWRG